MAPYIISFFVLPAICLALNVDIIENLYRKPIFRILSLVFVFICAVIHMSTTAVPYSREIYTLSVFIAALQPWKVSSKTIHLIAAYSYVIYILHYLPVELLSLISRHLKIEFTGGFVLMWSIIIYSISLISGILLRKLIPIDWLFPLIPIGHQKKTP